MALLFKTRLLQMEWWFAEKGGLSIFNELMAFAESTVATNFTTSGGITLGTSTFGAIDFQNANAVAATPSVAGTGAPIAPRLNQPGWGNGQQQVPGTNPRPPVLDQP